MSFQLILSPMALAQNIPGTEEGITNDAYKKTGTGSSGGYDFYISQIAGIGTGMLGASIISQCLEGLKTPSIATFMAGSLVHIASEILGAKTKKDRNRKKFDDLKLQEADLKKSGDTSQLESLKKFLEEEEETREFLRNRKNWMIAVDTIYVAAVGLAIAEEFTSLGVGAASGTKSCAIVSAAMAAESCVGAAAGYEVCLPIDTAANVAACELLMDIGYLTAKPLPSHSTLRARATSLCATATPYVAPCTDHLMSALAVGYAACMPAPTDGGASMFSWPKILSMGYGFGAGKLTEGGGEISQYGSMAVSLLTAFVPAVSRFVEQAYNLPIPRSITFGALAVMSGVNTVGLAQREKISEENIEKLKKGIANFKVETEGETSGVGLGAAPGDYNDPKKQTKTEIKKLVINSSKQCISNSSGQFDISEKACKKPFQLSKSSFSKISVPVLNNVANLATDMAQALSNGDQAKASGIAGQIGSLAARVKQTTESLKTKYNENQKKNNKPTVDFNKKISQQVASLQGALNQAAASQNIDLASLGAGSSSSQIPVKNSDPVITTSGKAPGVALPPADPFAGMGGTEEIPLDPVAATNEPNLDDLEIVEQDVSKQKEVSIFKQLSNRYILNYTKFFTRLKEPEAAPEEVKKN